MLGLSASVPAGSRTNPAKRSYLYLKGKQDTLRRRLVADGQLPKRRLVFLQRTSGSTRPGSEV